MENSPFGRLSAELRNRIYDLALEHQIIGLGDSKNTEAPMTRVCRQMRAECLTMHFARCEFITLLSATDATMIWLKTLGHVVCRNIHSLIISGVDINSTYILIDVLSEETWQRYGATPVLEDIKADSDFWLIRGVCEAYQAMGLTLRKCVPVYNAGDRYVVSWSATADLVQ